ncbi:hypothetical protein RBY4I_2086 [Rhodobacterales bacterium Y4I]|nr:hypothetical protein RBY4I_2086 [Rhodobacterales bacterium Y4I]
MPGMAAGKLFFKAAYRKPPLKQALLRAVAAAGAQAATS